MFGSLARRYAPPEGAEHRSTAKPLLFLKIVSTCYCNLRNYFFKELTFCDLKFTPKDGTEVELADLMINMGGLILVIQLKAREPSKQTSNSAIEKKWLEKKCKIAKKQIKDSFDYIKKNSLTIKNAQKQCIPVNDMATIIPLVVFYNDQIFDYEHILRKHSSDGIDVNCISFADYQTMCQELISPMEIFQYLEWRRSFYLNNGSVDIFIQETEGGIHITKPKNNESLIHSFLIEKYGEKALDFPEGFLEEFNRRFYFLHDHMIYESERNSTYSVIRFLAHLERNEIQVFVEHTNQTLASCKKGEYGILHSMRNPIKKYAILFSSSKEGEAYPLDSVVAYVKAKAEVDIVLYVIIYWESEMIYRIDFGYRHNREYLK